MSVFWLIFEEALVYILYPKLKHKRWFRERIRAEFDLYYYKECKELGFDIKFEEYFNARGSQWFY